MPPYRLDFMARASEGKNLWVTIDSVPINALDDAAAIKAAKNFQVSEPTDNGDRVALFNATNQVIWSKERPVS